MQFFDFHTHVFPEKIAEKATESICRFYGISHEFIGTSASLLRVGQAANVQGFLLLPVALKASNVRHINRFIADEVSLHPQFYGFAALHPDLDDPQAELREILRLGLRGIKIHPDMIRVAIDDPRMFPIYETIEDVLPIYLHMGDPRMDYSDPARLRHVMHMFPHLRVIAAHLGGWSMYDAALAALGDTDCMVDISSSLAFLTTEQMVRYIRAYSADRVLFGSDFPVWDPRIEAQKFLQLPLSDDEKERIAYRNARLFLESGT